ncbi:sigma-70 family RNA polymerase sigma factor [Nocardioides sp. Root151]|uniref:sigma-70 family RNA polymerase sigma factor n=1 Tax=Nocardioides sp. Root151 TaxID=1736475 RepID=UPI000A7D9B3F
MVTQEADLMRALHDEHAPALWAYALALTNGDRGRAEDVVQETLLRAWRHPEVLARSSGSARGWLLTVARRITIDEWRSSVRHPEVVTDSPPEPPSHDETDAALQAWLVADGLQRLSSAHRDVIVECYYRGHTTAEAARRLGVPDGTVKSRLHYALTSLRLVLQEMGVEDD